MRINTKTIETVNVRIRVIERDITDGLCGLPGKCMEKIAIERALRQIDPRGGDHKVRIDAGEIKFKMRGHRWSSPTPKIPKVNLIQFDKEDKARKRALREGVEFVSKVKPHKWIMTAVKGDKIIPLTPDRQKQINAARNQRIKEGRPDRTSYNLHKRVVGLGSV